MLKPKRGQVPRDCDESRNNDLGREFCKLFFKNGTDAGLVLQNLKQSIFKRIKVLFIIPKFTQYKTRESLKLEGYC